MCFSLGEYDVKACNMYGKKNLTQYVIGKSARRHLGMGSYGYSRDTRSAEFERNTFLRKDCRLLGCDVMYSASKLSAFRRNLRFQGRIV